LKQPTSAGENSAFAICFLPSALPPGYSLCAIGFRLLSLTSAKGLRHQRVQCAFGDAEFGGEAGEVMRIFNRLRMKLM